VLMYLEHRDVLFAGENVANAKNGGRCVPHLSQFGNIHTAIAALDRIESFQSHCLIPAHGEPVMGKGACKEVLADNRHYLKRLLEELHNANVSYWTTQQIESHRPSLDTVLLHTLDQYLPISRAFHMKNWEYCCKEAQTKIERSK
jgi:hypothetical protein